MLYIPSQDWFALVATPQNDIKTEKNGGEDRLGGAGKKSRKSDHCGRTGHTRDKCWKFHNGPTQGHGGERSGTTKSHAHMTKASQGPSQFMILNRLVS